MVQEMADEFKYDLASNECEGPGTSEGLETWELEQLYQIALCNAPHDVEGRFQHLLKMRSKHVT